MVKSIVSSAVRSLHVDFHKAQDGDKLLRAALRLRDLSGTLSGQEALAADLLAK